MKHLFLTSSLIFTLSVDSIRSQSEAVESEPEVISAEKSFKTDYRVIYEVNSKLILQMLENIRKYREDDSDTALQRDMKKIEIKKAEMALKKDQIGKPIVLKSLRIYEVTPEKDFSPYGIQQAKYLANKIRSDPQSSILVKNNKELLAILVGSNLAICEECWKSTGRYVADLRMPEPEGSDGYSDGISLEDRMSLEVLIKKIYPNAKEAASLKKESIIDASGIIKSISYSSASYMESVKIVIE